MDFDPFFQGPLVVMVIMIDDSKKRNRWVLNFRFLALLKGHSKGSSPFLGNVLGNCKVNISNNQNFQPHEGELKRR